MPHNWKKTRSGIEACRTVLARYPDAREPELHKLIIRDIIDTEVCDLVSTSTKSIADAGVQSADEARQQSAPLIRYSDDLFQANRDLRKFLYQNVYYNPRVSEVNRRACEMLRQVFQVYLADPDKLGETAAKRIETEGLHRTVCDYIAGMTDRYLMEENAWIAVCSRRPRAARLAGVNIDRAPFLTAKRLQLRSRSSVFFPKILNHQPQPFINGEFFQDALTTKRVGHKC